MWMQWLAAGVVLAVIGLRLVVNHFDRPREKQGDRPARHTP